MIFLTTEIFLITLIFFGFTRIEEKKTRVTEIPNYVVRTDKLK